MKNIERQKSLDKKKWEMSQEVGADLSGEMIYCEFCGCAVDKKCTATQDQRERNSLCARAYNRMKRNS